MNLNEIYCMDCLEGMKLLPEHMVDLCITSPPYADIKKYTDFDGIPADQYCDWFLPKIKEIERILKPTGSFILNINDKVEEGFRHPYVYELIYRITKETGLKLFERLFWNKMKFIPNPYRFGDKVEYLFWFAKEKGFKFKLDEMRVEYSETSINRMKNKLKKNCKYIKFITK